jgi:hypothetical protein
VVEHSPPLAKVKGSTPTAVAGSVRENGKQYQYYKLGNSCSSVGEHSPPLAKVKDSTPTAVAGSGREKMGNSIIIENWSTAVALWLSTFLLMLKSRV